MIILLVSCFNTYAQKQPEERRVYYLDVTGSMKSNKIWDEVRNNLKKAIDNVQDETTELIVIPFTDNNPGIDRVWKSMATDEGKKYLKDEIDKVRYETSNCLTNLYLPLNDFCNNHIDPNKINYMFLMTDGQDEEDRTQFRSLLQQWGGRYGEKHIYGFFVMLHKNAKDQQVEAIISKQKHLWKVETADVNINLIRIESDGIFNIRNDEYVKFDISGLADNIKIDVEALENPNYRVLKTSKNNNQLRVYLKNLQEPSVLPEEINIILNVKSTISDRYTFLVTDKLHVTCQNKKERTLKLTIL